MTCQYIINKFLSFTILLLLVVIQPLFQPAFSHPCNKSISLENLSYTDTIYLCNGPIELIGPAGYIQYNWNTGAISERITVNYPGMYVVTASLSSGETIQDTFIVKRTLKLTTRPIIGCGDDLILLNNGVIENIKGKVIEFFSDRDRINQLNASVKINTRYSTHDKFYSAAEYKNYIDELVNHPPTSGYGDAYLPEYRIVSNSIIFNGPKNNVAYKYTIRFYAKNAGLYRFRTSFDFGKGGAIFLDGNIAAYNNGNMWWDNNWNLPGQSLQWSSNLEEGMHEIFIYGLEDCCDGGGSAEYQGPDDPEYTAFSTFAYVKDPGTYYVSLHDPISGCSAEDSIIVTRSARPLMRVNSPPPACKPASINLTLPSVTEGSESSLKFLYFLNPDLTNPVLDPSAITESANYYIVGQAENGCYSIPQEILVTLFSPPQINLPHQAQAICLGSSISLPANDGIKYEWSPAMGLNNTEISNPVATPIKDTRYFVKVTSPNGCIGKDSVQIIVHQPIKITANGNERICEGKELQLNANGAIRYEWTPSATLSNANTASPTAVPTESIKYKVIGFSELDCFSDTAIVTVNVDPLPEVIAGNDTSIPVGKAIQLKIHSSNDIIKYEWTPAIGLSCTNCPEPYTTPVNGTLYTITVQNEAGCLAFDNIKISLNCSIENVYIPNAFTPNNDGRNDFFYPIIKGIRTINYMRIYNRWGKLVFERKNFRINNRDDGWDGKVNGLLQSSQLFVYAIQLECENGQLIDLKGDINLIQ